MNKPLPCHTVLIQRSYNLWMSHSLVSIDLLWKSCSTDTVIRNTVLRLPEKWMINYKTSQILMQDLPFRQQTLRAQMQSKHNRLNLKVSLLSREIVQRMKFKWFCSHELFVCNPVFVEEIPKGLYLFMHIFIIIRDSTFAFDRNITDKISVDVVHTRHISIINFWYTFRMCVLCYYYFFWDRFFFKNKWIYSGIKTQRSVLIT